MVMEQALLLATQKLKAAEIPQPRLEANVLMQHVMQTDRAGLILRQTKVLDTAAVEAYDALVDRRCAGEPTAYILGTKEFMGLEFKVTPAVLIPRPDTEILCMVVMEAAKQYTKPQILDLCCGSGCIGVSLAHFIQDAQVTMLDLSKAAVAVATENAKKYVPNSTKVREGDAFALEGTYDIIVSNPPYIESAVIADLQTEVRVHEPHMALDGGADGMLFYTHFAEKLQQNLNAGGMLALEVGHTQAQAVARLLEDNGWVDIKIQKDYAGIERVVLGYKK